MNNNEQSFEIDPALYLIGGIIVFIVLFTKYDFLATYAGDIGRWWFAVGCFWYQAFLFKRNKIKNIEDCFENSEEVSQALQNYAKNVLQTLNIESWETISIKKTDQMLDHDKFDHFAVQNGIFLNESLFNELDELKKRHAYTENALIIEEAKRFIVGHEAMHIKKKHIGNEMIYFTIFPLVVHYSLVLFFYMWDIEMLDFLGDYYMPVLWSALISVSLGMAEQNFIKRRIARSKRKQEKEADIQAAVALNCVRGGVYIMEQIKKRALKSGEFVSKKDKYSLHPEYDTRIEYLRALDRQM